MGIYVPENKGHPACSIILLAVDESLIKARTGLIRTLRTTDVAELAAAWQRYDASVVEADAVYRCLDAICTAVDADLAPARRDAHRRRPSPRRPAPSRQGSRS